MNVHLDIYIFRNIEVSKRVHQRRGDMKMPTLKANEISLLWVQFLFVIAMSFLVTNCATTDEVEEEQEIESSMENSESSDDSDFGETATDEEESEPITSTDGEPTEDTSTSETTTYPGSDSEAPSGEEGMPSPQEAEENTGESTTTTDDMVSSPLDSQVQGEDMQPSSFEGKTFKYIVSSGESLSSIAKKVYGSYSKWEEIVGRNKEVIKNNDTIYPGDVLEIPITTPQSEDYYQQNNVEPEETNKISVVVESGDSLSILAKKHLHNGNSWRHIYTQVSDSVRNPDLIFPGQSIVFYDFLGSSQQAAPEQQSTQGEVELPAETEGIPTALPDAP